MKGRKRLTVVIKLGTSSIVDETTHEPHLSILSLIVETAAQLVKDGHQVVIVSSGAVGMGLRRMQIRKKPKSLIHKQALASVGQCRLLALYDRLFEYLHQPIAQILLTRGDIANRTQYLNAQNTFAELLSMGVIPIVNENDSIAVSELRALEKFGDNDTLSAITAAMVQADYLFLMTDVDCLYDKNPRTHADASAIDLVAQISKLDAHVSSAGSSLGTGGMATKIVAARLATSAGVTTVITRASKPGNILEIVKNDLEKMKDGASTPSTLSTPSTPSAERAELIRSKSAAHIGINTALSNAPSKDVEPSMTNLPLHTRFVPDPSPIRDRSFWLLHGLAAHGTIYIDKGAYRALVAKAGLLPAGIVDVQGQFVQQEAVKLVVLNSARDARSAQSSTTSSPDTDGKEVGRALVNYSATEIARIKGCQSHEIQSILGFADSEYVAQRENVSLIRLDDGESGTIDIAVPA